MSRSDAGQIQAEGSCPLCRSSRAQVVWRQKTVVKRAYPSWPKGVDDLAFHSCLDCGLVFKDPRTFLTLAEQRTHYLRHNNDFDDPRYRNYLMRLAEPLMAKLVLGCKGLDYGCGPTPLMERIFHERGFACSSHDPCFFSHEEALQEKYDFVTCSEVVEHFQCPDQEFEKLARLVKPGGWLAIMTQAPPPDISTWSYHLDITHVVFYSRATFSWIAREHGFAAEHFPHGVTLLQKQ